MHATDQPVLIRTKVIATLGPASSDKPRLLELVRAGLDLCRLNFSHGTLDDHARVLATVREISAELDEPLCVIGDLCGPKIRVGTCPADVTLVRGQTVRLVAGTDACTAERLTVNYERLVDEVAVGDRIYIDDGLIRLRVTERAGEALLCVCDVGGPVGSHKGVNLPDSHLSTPALSQKDHRDLEWALQHNLDYVALSFVRRPDDLYQLKRIIKDRGQDTPVIIKIEKPEALDHLDELIAQTDAVLVARGDLGVETDIWRVPLVQKDIIKRCQAAAVPVIVATQMLQSMVSNPMPTRAEVSDVANAVFDQADAVMLSGETAVGRYPVEAVDMMNRITASTGRFLAQQPATPRPACPGAAGDSTDAIAHAAVQAALDLNARVVAVWTATGATARRVARHRLPIPVVALTYNEGVWRRLNLLYGVIPLRTAPLDHPSQMAKALDALLIERRLAQPGDRVVVVTSTRPTTPGATNTVHIHRVMAAGAPEP